MRLALPIFLAFLHGPVLAAVVLDPVSGVPVRYAEEINATVASPVTLSNAGGVLDIDVALSYSFSQGEVRYARLACPDHVRFLSGTTVTPDDPASASIGAVNGLGSNAISFSVTAQTSGLTASDRLVIDGDREITSASDAMCSFALYDTPSQAQAGGAAGRVIERGGNYLDFVPSYALRVDARGAATADVEAVNGPYTGFTSAAPTNSSDVGALGRFSYGTVADVQGDVQPFKPDGTQVTLADLMGPDTALVFSGDFSPAGNVYLSSASDCSLVDYSASSTDERAARFEIGDVGFVGTTLCYRSGGGEIQALETSVELQPVAVSTAFAPSARGPLTLGSIERNGTELQAPLVQMPEGSFSRIVLTNEGSEKRSFRIQLLGSTAASASETSSDYIGLTSYEGVIPIEGALVVDLAEAFPRERFTGPPRGFVRVIITGPSRQIQGLYQLVEPRLGAVSNYVMVRPGTN